MNENNVLEPSLFCVEFVRFLLGSRFFWVKLLLIIGLAPPPLHHPAPNMWRVVREIPENAVTYECRGSGEDVWDSPNAAVTSSVRESPYEAV